MLSESKRAKLPTVSLLLLVVVSGSVFSTENFPICKPGEEFWSTEKISCNPCTKCAPKFTISPCAVHKDAICGPLSALELDWSFLSTRRKSEIDQSAAADTLISKMLFRFPDLEKRRGKSSGTNEMIRTLDDQNDLPLDDEIKNSFVDFRERRTSGEGNILWDAQTRALVLAVFACTVFFIVAGCSALIYVRQWRRIKRHFEPVGIEEISARLNQIMKAELAELTGGAPMNPVEPETRCQYLEKLLDRKLESPVLGNDRPETNGNLYIEEGETRRNKRFQIARIHRNIESILSNKTIR